MTVNDSKRFHFLMHEIDARINNETMDRYGIKMQSLVAMEERTKPLEFKGLRHNLIEEMADVLICMDQLIEFYEVKHYELQEIIQAKQKRQAERLEEE